jgi:hypothetical protein
MTQPSSDSRSAAARWLMADLLEWHQRDARPEWLIHFQRIKEYDDQDFIESGDCIGGLSLVGQVGTIDKSNIWQFRFPDQDHKFKEGDEVYDPKPAKVELFSSTKEVNPFPKSVRVGEIAEINDSEGTIDIKIGKGQEQPTATAFVPGRPIPDEDIRVALQRLAQSVLDEATSPKSVKYRGAIALLRRDQPRFRDGASLDPKPGESASDRFIRLAAQLDHSYLVVQGPPGSGKTWALSRAVLECVADGQRVGLSGFKHETMKTMVDAIREALTDPVIAAKFRHLKTPVKAIRKIETGATPAADPTGFVTETTKNKDVDNAIELRTHQIVAGTAWLFAPNPNKKKGARPEMELDVVFIDEAGQMSLANALAIATSAKSVVLVGDPQQLAQPGKGAHPLLPEPADELFPRASGASALEHVLAGRATVPTDEGIFLDVTFRLHPEICKFISAAMYDGRLEHADNCQTRAITIGSGARETGIRWCPVEHDGNKISSPEEVAAIEQIVRQLDGASITNKNGQTRPINSANDIMLVTPYNSQANDLRRAMPDLRVGTVDKFQGLEAPIVIFSLVASTSEDVPHGLEFLYSTNRLNVAVSRAKTLCIVVGSPRLLAAKCNSVKQLQLINVLCKYAEMAERWQVE